MKTEHSDYELAATNVRQLWWRAGFTVIAKNLSSISTVSFHGFVAPFSFSCAHQEPLGFKVFQLTRLKLQVLTFYSHSSVFTSQLTQLAMLMHFASIFLSETAKLSMCGFAGDLLLPLVPSDCAVSFTSRSRASKAVCILSLKLHKYHIHG